MIMDGGMVMQPLTEGPSRRGFLWAITSEAGATSLKGSMTPLFRLPGDIVVHRKNFSFYFPVAFSIIISIVFSFIFWLIERGEK